MPRNDAPVTSVASDVEAKKPEALLKALRATAEVRERSFGKPAFTTNDAAAQRFYDMVNTKGSPQFGDATFAAIGKAVTGVDIPVIPTKDVMPQFLAVMVDPDGNPFIFVNSQGGRRYADGTRTKAPKKANGYSSLGYSVINDRDYQPASDEQVAEVVNGLFAVRPALTLRLFFDGVDSGE